MKIFVGNLHENASEEHVRELFKKYGRVGEVKIIMDMETGHSKGFGFVEMDDPADGRVAITKLHNLNYMNQFLEVAEAIRREGKETKFIVESRSKKADMAKKSAGKKRS